MRQWLRCVPVLLSLTACSGGGKGGGGDTPCTSDSGCTANGVTVCDPNGTAAVGTCAAVAGGCFKVQAFVACPSAQQTCTAGACACNNALCTVGDTQCAGDASIQTCVLDAPGGCGIFGTPAACTAGQLCAGSAPTAACACPARGCAAAPTVTQVHPATAWAGDAGDGIVTDAVVSIYGTGFQPTPEVQLRNRSSGATFQAQGVTYLSPTKLSARIPAESASMGVGVYDVEIVNPDLVAATWPDPFQIVSTSPPLASGLTPAAAPISSCPVSIAVAGSGFRAGMTAELLVPLGTTCPSGSSPGLDDAGDPTCSVDVASIPSGTAATLSAPCFTPGVYPLRLVNDDGQGSVFRSFKFDPASGGGFAGGTAWSTVPDALIAPRWRHGVTAGFEAGRTWLYAAGGQSAATSAPLATVELAEVDAFGAPGGWSVAQQFASGASPRVNNTLGGLATPQGRTGLELVRVGNFLFALGGANVSTNDQTVRYAVSAPGDQGILRSGERAEILGGRTTPRAVAVTATGVVGLPRGTWFYRVSGVTADGESLASEPVAAYGASGTVHMTWSAPSSGAAASYNVYRSLAADGRAGSEVLLATDVTGTSFDDDGAGALSPAPSWARTTISAGGSLANDLYQYRVSACLTPCSDVDRSGETLASYSTDVVVDGTMGRTVLLDWDPIPGATYRVFKWSSTRQQFEQLAQDVTGTQRPWADDGSLLFPMAPVLPKEEIAPLPPGSLSTWTTLPGLMVRAREGLRAIPLRLSSGQVALHAVGGRSSTAPNQSYLTSVEVALVNPETGQVSASWAEQPHALTTARAFFSLVTSQDRDWTPIAPPVYPVTSAPQPSLPAGGATEWLVAVGGGSLMAATANGQTNSNALSSLEACAVDLTTGSLVRCDTANGGGSPWAVQGVTTQHTGIGIDTLLYAAGGSPFLMSWPGTNSEVLGGAPTPDNGTPSRFTVDVTSSGGAMTADPALVCTLPQSNSSKFSLRSYYKLIRVGSFAYAVGGYAAGGVTGTIERHQD